MTPSLDNNDNDSDDNDRKLPAVTTTSELHDDDNWSRQVATDEAVTVMESFLLHAAAAADVDEHVDTVVSTSSHNATLDDHDRDLDTDSRTTEHAASEGPLPPPPMHAELSLKERLVLRERQRRIETERARLKRQFALSNHHDHHASSQDEAAYASSDHGDNDDDMRDTTSVAEESTKAHPDEDLNDESLGFNMERFLRLSDSFNPQLETTAEEHRAGGDPPSQGGVVMERFLRSEPIVEEQVATGEEENMRAMLSVALDNVGIRPDAAPAESFRSYGDDVHMSANASMHVEVDEDGADRHDPFTPHITSRRGLTTGDTHSTASTEPRVLRLTEADMQEFAGIDQASIGNGPPSERDSEEISEIGELAHFDRDEAYNPSGLDTPTTAQESASIVSGGNTSAGNRASAPSLGSMHGESHVSSAGRDVASDDHSDAFVPDDGSDVSVNSMNETHPPSVVARDDTEVDFLRDSMGGLDLTMNGEEANQVTDEGDLHVMPVNPEEAVEARINLPFRPGMGNLNILRSTPSSPGSLGIRDTLAEPVSTERFEYDTYAPSSPIHNIVPMVSSFRDLPYEDPWSPVGQMQVSPILNRRLRGASLENVFSRHELQSAPLIPPTTNESTPLLGEGVPPDIVISRSHSDPGVAPGESLRGNQNTVRSAVDSMFSGIRSDDESAKEEDNNDCERYLNSSVLAKAFPERMFALTVTLILEIPVLLMISGGSDQLCKLIGRSRYQLLIGFLPLTSAISGNVGLQASTLTTRAISHRHVTPKSWWRWLVNEVSAAIYLGLGMGLLLGAISFVASGMDFGFGLAIFTAQLISIVTAGITGTFAPLLFSFIFKRDSGKWGGPLETAIQDIIGSFAMIVISYQLLRLFGSGEVAPGDMCGSADLDV